MFQSKVEAPEVLLIEQDGTQEAQQGQETQQDCVRRVPEALQRALGFAEPTRFIAGPLYDAVFFIGAPLFALALGIFLSVTRLSEPEWTFGGHRHSVTTSLVGIFIHAHLVIVLFRSHGNPQVRRTYPLRFWLVPPLLLAAMLTSKWMLVIASVVVTFWDVYHSGLQTFGLGRIYDARVGNHAPSLRKLDLVLNHLLYAGPIVAGAAMLDHFEELREFEKVGSTLFHAVPAFMQSNQRYFAFALLLGGGIFLLYYVYENVRLYRQGQAVSLPKVYLLAATGACSVYTWGFNSWGEAFFIMNFFHALQYFALIWWKEQGNIQKTFTAVRLRFSKPVAFLGFLALAFSYGLIIEATPPDVPVIYPLSLLISILHFWYDGFIWSVRKGQV